jgi:hypothetical protein
MASWDVQDLLKEIADMEVISMRNPGSDLLPKMQQALVSKIECTQLITYTLQLCEDHGLLGEDYFT